MKFTRYGISISLLTDADIEMVRQWRNDPVVVRNYQYREYITPEMQAEWFKTINNINNLYCIIEYKGEKVGVVNLKNIDWEKMKFETGIFIPYEKYHNSPLPAMISLITTEIPFRLLNWNIGYAHVLKENKPTQTFIKQLGYELASGQEDKENQEYFITSENFEKKAGRIRKAIDTVTGKSEMGTLFISAEEAGTEPVCQWQAIVSKGNCIHHIETTENGTTFYFL